MKKIICGLLLCSLLIIITGCDNCGDGYHKDGDYCISDVEIEELLVITYECEGEWHVEGAECVQGTMPKIGDGCEEGTTDRVGSDGFCHHYQPATIKYTCKNDAVLKDNKCYEKEVK